MCCTMEISDTAPCAGQSGNSPDCLILATKSDKILCTTQTDRINA